MQKDSQQATDQQLHHEFFSAISNSGSSIEMIVQPKSTHKPQNTIQSYMDQDDQDDAAVGLKQDNTQKVVSDGDSLDLLVENQQADDPPNIQAIQVSQANQVLQSTVVMPKIIPQTFEHVPNSGTASKKRSRPPQIAKKPQAVFVKEPPLINQVPPQQQYQQQAVAAPQPKRQLDPEQVKYEQAARTFLFGATKIMSEAHGLVNQYRQAKQNIKELVEGIKVKVKFLVGGLESIMKYPMNEGKVKQEFIQSELLSYVSQNQSMLTHIEGKIQMISCYMQCLQSITPSMLIQQINIPMIPQVSQIPIPQQQVQQVVVETPQKVVATTVFSKPQMRDKQVQCKPIMVSQMTMAKPPDGPRKINTNTQTTHKCKLLPSEFGIYQEEVLPVKQTVTPLEQIKNKNEKAIASEIEMLLKVLKTKETNDLKNLRSQELQSQLVDQQKLNPPSKVRKFLDVEKDIPFGNVSLGNSQFSNEHEKRQANFELVPPIQNTQFQQQFGTQQQIPSDNALMQFFSNSMNQYQYQQQGHLPQMQNQDAMFNQFMSYYPQPQFQMPEQQKQYAPQILLEPIIAKPVIAQLTVAPKQIIRAQANQGQQTQEKHLVQKQKQVQPEEKKYDSSNKLQQVEAIVTQQIAKQPQIPSPVIKPSVKVVIGQEVDEEMLMRNLMNDANQENISEDSLKQKAVDVIVADKSEKIPHKDLFPLTDFDQLICQSSTRYIALYSSKNKASGIFELLMGASSREICLKNVLSIPSKLKVCIHHGPRLICDNLVYKIEQNSSLTLTQTLENNSDISCGISLNDDDVVLSHSSYCIIEVLRYCTQKKLYSSIFKQKTLMNCKDIYCTKIQVTSNTSFIYTNQRNSQKVNRLQLELEKNKFKKDLILSLQSKKDILDMAVFSDSDLAMVLLRIEIKIFNHKDGTIINDITFEVPPTLYKLVFTPHFSYDSNAIILLQRDKELELYDIRNKLTDKKVVLPEMLDIISQIKVKTLKNEGVINLLINSQGSVQLLNLQVGPPS